MVATSDKAVSRDAREALRRAVTTFHSATQIPVAMGGLAASSEQLTITEHIGLRTEALVGLGVDTGSGLGGRVMVTKRPLGVSDYTRAKVITHDYDREVLTEGLRSIAAVPVIVRREVRGVLYAGVHAAVRLGDRVLDELTLAARDLEQDLTLADVAVPSDVASRGQPSVAEWEQIRMVHSRLRLLAAGSEDSRLKTEIEAICDQMLTAPSSEPVPRLSARELDVLACVALGRTNIETAKDMGIGAETVKSYLRSGMRKLGAHTRYEAVNAARRIGALP